jgi:hypothetical protein
VGTAFQQDEACPAARQAPAQVPEVVNASDAIVPHASGDDPNLVGTLVALAGASGGIDRDHDSTQPCQQGRNPEYFIQFQIISKLIENRLFLYRSNRPKREFCRCRED